MKIKKLLKKLKRKYWIFKLIRNTGFGKAPNEYFLVSYPKSANTWVRFLLSNLLVPDSKDLFLQDLWKFVPDVQDPKHLEYLKQPNTPFSHLPFRFLKSHFEFNPIFKKRKVIYIVRDGRDVVNSYFYYLNSRREKPLKISEIIRPSGLIQYGTWSEHVVGWIRPASENFYLIRYENLLTDTKSEIRKLADYLGWKITDEEIATAIEKSSFDKLKKMEEEKGVVYQHKLNAGSETSPFFRKGKAGDWKSSFSPEDMEEFWKYQNEGMGLAGYEARNSEKR